MVIEQKIACNYAYFVKKETKSSYDITVLHHKQQHGLLVCMIDNKVRTTKVADAIHVPFSEPCSSSLFCYVTTLDNSPLITFKKLTNNNNNNNIHAFIVKDRSVIVHRLTNDFRCASDNYSIKEPGMYEVLIATNNFWQQVTEQEACVLLCNGLQSMSLLVPEHLTTLMKQSKQATKNMIVEHSTDVLSVCAWLLGEQVKKGEGIAVGIISINKGGSRERCRCLYPHSTKCLPVAEVAKSKNYPNKTDKRIRRSQSFSCCISTGIIIVSLVCALMIRGTISGASL